MSKIVEINNITKTYDEDVVLNNINLYINQNEFVTLLGPSGCGKTTLLRLIGGFESQDYGSILFDGMALKDIPAHKREINTVFQNYALFTNMNVYDNVAFGLKIKKIKTDDILIKVNEALKLVKLVGYEKRRIDQLSGGQQQRVAIARAIVNKPKLLLLDEPLGALDLKLRQDMQYELKEMQKALGISFLFVTHDQEEALTMSDTVVVMNNGVIQQIGSPEDIYNEPKNKFTAQFIGESNVIDGVMIKDYVAQFEGIEFKCVDKGFINNELVDIVIRPEDINLVKKEVGKITGIIDDITFKGVHFEIIVMVDDIEYIIHSTKRQKIGDIVSLDFGPDDIHVMKKTDEKIK